MTNRLKLDFSLNYNDERSQFLNNYLQSEMFQKNPPTEKEIETMANYVLWGKDRTTGLNGRQAGIELETKHGTWDDDQPLESLDALMESPTFNEAALHEIDSIPFVQKHHKLSRDEVLADAPSQLREQFLNLFRRIDTTEICINYYEIAHGRRVKPPRDWLLNKFTDEEKASFQETITHWNEFKYLKMRHHLVELRQEQYSLKDQYAPAIIQLTNPIFPEPMTEPDFDAGIEVLPLGICPKRKTFPDFFLPLRDINPQLFATDDLTRFSEIYWQKKQFKPTNNETWIDFRNGEHLYQLLLNFYELREACDDTDEDDNLPSLMRTLDFYIQEADLSEPQREILDKKLKKIKNSDIAFEINKKWNKAYTDNYISTIFKQRIIPKIADAAKQHELIVGNLFFPEEFKTCSCCGKILLKHESFFTHKSRSKDGFTTKCKVCEKKERQEKL